VGAVLSHVKKRTNDFSQIMEIYVLLDSKSISNNYTQRYGQG